MPLVGLLSRHGSVIRAAILHNTTLVHLDADTLDRQPLYTQIYPATVRHKDHHHYWVECPFGPALLSQEKNLPPLTVGQNLSVQISREAFFDTAENELKAPHVSRKLAPEISRWDQILPHLIDLDTLLIDDSELMIKVRQYCKTKYPHLPLQLVHHNLFEDYGLEEVWASLEFPTVQFPGGSLHIEITAAAILIDINGTGKAEEINQNALEPLAQHLIWRNLSGSTLVEFVNHGQGQHRPYLLEVLRDRLGKISPPFIVHGFTKLGFLELSREKRRNPLHHRKVF
ncbi:MAG: ribonuclease E/G [Candidatus Paracaedibacteraceae bacterium]|nr:ribonuclease E/G [Candidatus Paracaedibacteraceae bacterium]